jgi:hypothetical protein
MTPLRATMIRDMEVQRLAPKTQKAYSAAVAGLAQSMAVHPTHCPRPRSVLLAPFTGRTPPRVEFL